MTNTTPTPHLDEETQAHSRESAPWQVVLFNDEVHSFDEVILQVQKATGCSNPEAERITLQAHFKGKACTFQGTFSTCYKVAGILRAIQLIVEIQG